MDPIAARFAEAFRPWSITLPETDLRERRAGFISKAGWLIQYCFGEDEAGTFLDYYAAHRMTSDSHVRIHEDGRTVGLPTLVGTRTSSQDPIEDRRLEEEYLRSNREVAEMLCAKGFDRFTINMFLHAGLDGAHDVRGEHMPLEDNSVKLVAPHGDAEGFDKRYQEKWLIYCPAIANDTLLLMITALDSYSIRSYGGHLGVNTTGRHAEGVRTTGEFMEQFDPDRPYEVSGLGFAVDRADKWAEFIEGKFEVYREKHSQT